MLPIDRADVTKRLDVEEFDEYIDSTSPFDQAGNTLRPTIANGDTVLVLVSIALEGMLRPRELGGPVIELHRR